MAINSELVAFMKETSAADQPRDAIHLRHQELVIRTGLPGGWRSLPEEQLDRDARTSRWGDVLMHRGRQTLDEYALFEIFDWFEDVGAHTREWLRRLDALERYAISRMRGDTLPRTAGCWIVRATARNRRLIADHAEFFSARFPGSGQAWLQALATQTPMPKDAALLWVSVKGERLFPARPRATPLSKDSGSRGSRAAA